MTAPVPEQGASLSRQGLYLTAPETQIMAFIGYLAKLIDPDGILGEAIAGQWHGAGCRLGDR